jgi:Cu/Ag efflux protein CusF
MHGEIAELKLPAMTLVYLVEPQLIQGIQPGDQVTFTVVRQNGDYVIIEIRKG